ncbi:MAG: hypothetical protein WCE75_09410 [Terracidiphilus sp.]
MPVRILDRRTGRRIFEDSVALGDFRIDLAYAPDGSLLLNYMPGSDGLKWHFPQENATLHHSSKGTGILEPVYAEAIRRPPIPIVHRPSEPQPRGTPRPDRLLCGQGGKRALAALDAWWNPATHPAVELRT